MQMTFVARPSDVRRMLSGMTYESLGPEGDDEIAIAVYDGEGGGCLTAEEHDARRGGEALLYRESQRGDGAAEPYYGD